MPSAGDHGRRLFYARYVHLQVERIFTEQGSMSVNKLLNETPFGKVVKCIFSIDHDLFPNLSRRSKLIINLEIPKTFGPVG